MEGKPWCVQTEAGSLVHVFEQYAKQIDDFNLRMEAVRIVSREITKDSKNAIFLLHRSGPNTLHKVLEQAKVALDKVRLKFARLAAAVESDQEFYRFQNSITQGVQEYIEAESFHYFLLTSGALISKEQIIEGLIAACPGLSRFPIVTSDYLQGIADLSGEVMRKSITWATGGDLESVTRSSRFMQDLLVILQNIPLHHIRGWQMKIDTLRASTGKVENALFKLHLKRIEFPNQPSLVRMGDDDADDDRHSARPIPA